jgi:hypothetical protein
MLIYLSCFAEYFGVVPYLPAYREVKRKRNERPKERKEQKAMSQKQEGDKSKAGKAKGSKTSHEEITTPSPAKRKTPKAEKQLTALPVTKERVGGPPEKIDLGKALELRLKGVSFGDIAEHFNCSKTAVIQRLKPYASTTGIDTEVYIKNRARIIANRGAAVLSHLTEEKLKGASAKDLAMTFGILYDKERLETGQSTSNQSVFFHIVAESDEAEG